MAIHLEWTEEQKQQWEDWLKGRPPVIQIMARVFPPNTLFRMKESNHRCYPISYNEDGTLSVAVTGEFNRVLFSRLVFSVDPDNLEECELPLPGEDVGDTAAEAGYTEEDIKTILLPKLKEKNNPCPPG